MNDNIVKFQRGFHVNIGFFLVAIIFIYIAFHIFSSVTKVDVTVYEVEEGTIATNNSYQALAVRQEEIVNADHEGKVYYYENNKSRVGVKSAVYAIDSKGDIAELMNSESDEEISLDEKELKIVTNDLSNFIHDYNANAFSDVYSFKNNLGDTLSQVHTQKLRDEYASQITEATNNNTLISYNAIKPGLLCYVIDGYENLTVDSFDSGSFDRGAVNYVNLRAQSDIAANQPAYKLITSENWNLIMPIEEKNVEAFSEMENVRIRFLADNAKTWASCTVVERAGSHYLVLSLDDSLDRYADQRFINIELLLDSERGLKIPNTSITKKEFFVVPKSCFMQGADSKNQGLMVRREQKDEFVSPTIYFETEEAYYIDDEYLENGEKVLFEGGNDIYIIGTDTDSLPGVYSVNKGYTVFKKIEQIYKNEDYTIIKSGTSYGIALYDHIVLQADSIGENEIIN